MLLRLSDIGALSQSFRIFMRWSLALFDEKVAVLGPLAEASSELVDFAAMQENFLGKHAAPEIGRVCASRVLGAVGDGAWRQFRRNAEAYYQLTAEERIEELMGNAADLRTV